MVRDSWTTSGDVVGSHSKASSQELETSARTLLNIKSRYSRVPAASNRTRRLGIGRPPPYLALLLTGPSKIVAVFAPLTGHNLWKGPAAERARCGCRKSLNALTVKVPSRAKAVLGHSIRH